MIDFEMLQGNINTEIENTISLSPNYDVFSGILDDTKRECGVLTLLIAEVLDGDKAMAVRLGACIELVRSASFVFEEKEQIIAGMRLPMIGISLAFRTNPLAGIKLCECWDLVCEGYLTELLYPSDNELSKLSLIDGKVASFFAVAGHLGSLCCGGKWLQELSMFGKYIGRETQGIKGSKELALSSISNLNKEEFEEYRRWCCG